LGAVVSWALWDKVRELPAMATLDVRAFGSELQELTMLVVLYSLPVIMVIAAADYGYSAWKMSQDLKMTDRELKDQHKQQEGDPQFKARVRQRQRQIAMSTMIQALREADVVVTNPTHYAVALRYQRGRDDAPVVVAKGVDHLALHIRAKAKEFGVPRIENRPLARGLHANVKEGHPIPEEFYGPVAQVLAVIYKQRAKKSAV
ncbi:MAG: flagellar biosynthetic protein FlhB, partial [Kiritimatiellia bacterium]